MKWGHLHNLIYQLAYSYVVYQGTSVASISCNSEVAKTESKLASSCQGLPCKKGRNFISDDQF